MKHKALVFIILLVSLLLIWGHRFDIANFVARATMIENAENEDSESGPIINIQDEIINIHMDVPAGWSLISLPLCPDNAYVSSLFPGARVVYGYKIGSGYVRVKKLEAGRGYWILLDKAESYPVKGRLIKEYTWTRNEYGWKLIGGCTHPARISTDNGTTKSIYRSLGGIIYQHLGSENINPGEGYWVFLKDLRVYVSYDIRIISNGIMNFTMDLPAGWSMISLPLCPDNKSVSSIFPGAKVYEFSGGGGVKVQVHELECGKGYWILLEEAQSFPLAGKSIEENIWTVNEDGWELIGGCACPAEASIDKGNIDVIYRFEKSKGYVRVREGEKLDPGEGYWIFLKDIVDQAELRIYGICDICYFSDDFEDGLGKWIVSGSDWAIIETDYCNPNSVTDSPDGDYPPYANSEMILRDTIDLSDSSAPVLSFWHKILLYNQKDHGYVEISEDGGITWDILKDFTNTYQSTWSLVRIDLNTYKTTHVLIRFRLRADGSYQADGWTIDDVSICEKDTQTISFPFHDDFENGLDNWLVGGDSWAIIDSNYCSPNHSATESPHGDYPPYANSTLILSHPIDLSSSVSPVLSFWHKILLYNQNDHVYVEISEDGGITWDILKDFTNTYQSTRSLVRIDLSAYKTTPLLIRFRLCADGSYQADGWTIDDVSICEKDTQTISFPFHDDFENGLDNWLVGGDSWAIIDSNYCSPNHSATESPHGDYPPYANSTLILSHPIDLSSSASPVLDICHKICLYNQHDHGFIEISEDGGFTWGFLAEFINTCYSTWSFLRIDLSPYKTKPILIRFRLRANDSYQADGWHIDDVKIRELFD